MYKKLEAINTANHKEASIKPVESIAYAKEHASAPVTLGEFYQACKDYPVVFAKDVHDEWSAVAIFGLKEKENLFIKDDKWDSRSYLPAFFRKYPFIFARQDDTNLVLAVDKEYIDPAGGDENRKLFTTEGQNSTFLEGIMQFLNEYQKDAKRTANFIKALDELELLEMKNIQITDTAGEKFAINGFYVVNEEKLQHLSKKKQEKICNEGLMPFITAHQISLSSTQKLLAMRG